jgi:hypothetical protein
MPRSRSLRDAFLVTRLPLSLAPRRDVSGKIESVPVAPWWSRHVGEGHPYPPSVSWLIVKLVALMALLLSFPGFVEPPGRARQPFVAGSCSRRHPGSNDSAALDFFWRTAQAVSGVYFLLRRKRCRCCEI